MMIEFRSATMLTFAFLLGVASPVLANDCVSFAQPLQQGVYTWGQVDPGSRVTLNGEALDVLADGTFFLGFGRDADATARLAVTGVTDCSQQIVVAKRQYSVSRIEGVPQRTVTPPEADRVRIRAERQRVVAAKGQRIHRQELAEAVVAGFQWPVLGRISGVYGSQRIYNGVPGNPHYGVDVARPTGTPVYAPLKSVVTLAEPDLFYSGGTLILDHGYGLSSSLLHMSRLHVAEGDEVEAGQLIGEVGSTGRATGPHLDWRMSWRDRRIDPQLLVSGMPPS